MGVPSVVYASCTAEVPGRLRTLRRPGAWAACKVQHLPHNPATLTLLHFNLSPLKQPRKPPSRPVTPNKMAQQRGDAAGAVAPPPAADETAVELTQER